MNETVNDPLVQCLMALSRHHGGAATSEALVSGLPLEEGLLTPRLFDRAASRIGFTSNIIKKSPKSISAGLLPAVILGGDNQAEIDALNLELVANSQRADDWNCPSDIPDVAAVDMQALYEKVDRELNIEDGVEFGGDGGIGGESGFMEDFEGDPFDLSADAVMEAVEIFVYYASDSIEIPMEFDPQIQEIAAKMTEFADTKSLIEGHADDGGIHSYNNELSVGRATGVKRRLEQHFAIDPERIEIIGFGKDRPISIEADQKSNNRRAVIILE